MQPRQVPFIYPVTYAEDARFLNAYLEITGDYGSLRLLPYYLVYRAMVRAKIARIRGSDEMFLPYLGLAETLTRPAPPSSSTATSRQGSSPSTSRCSAWTSSSAAA